MSTSITVVGAGYVGSVTAACLAEVGHEVICADINPSRIDAIRRGRAPVAEPGLSDVLSALVRSGRLKATTDVVGAVAAGRITMIAVGTPMAGQTLDLSALSRACEQIGLGLREQRGYHVVAVRSTVLPGTTHDVVRARILEASARPEEEIGWCVNPEFLREGSAVEDARQPDRIVIGQSDAQAGQTLAQVYALFGCPVVRTTLRNAELIKCASNALLATLISFSNELASICEHLPDTDVEEVMRALHLDRRWSPTAGGRRVSPEILDYVRAGCGFGGSCLPKDVQALATFATQQGMTPHLLDAVLEVNHQRPQHLVKLLEQVLPSLDGATVAVFGLAFKPGTDDVRESPALAVIETLLRAGADVRAYDPIAGLSLGHVRVCQTAEEACTAADAVVLVTAWPQFAALDWPAVCRRMRQPIVVDGRGALRQVSFPSWVKYVSVGVAPAAAAAQSPVSV